MLSLFWSGKIFLEHSFKALIKGYFQFCTFRKGDKSCDIVWKRDPYNVTMGECDDFAGRVEFRVSF